MRQTEAHFGKAPPRVADVANRLLVMAGCKGVIQIASRVTGEGFSGASGNLGRTSDVTWETGLHGDGPIGLVRLQAA